MNPHCGKFQISFSTQQAVHCGQDVNHLGGCLYTMTQAQHEAARLREHKAAKAASAEPACTPNSDLPLYQPRTRCMKCGSRKQTVRWADGALQDGGAMRQDVMLVGCDHCQFNWLMRPNADAKYVVDDEKTLAELVEWFNTVTKK